MKRALSLLLAVALFASIAVGCASSPTASGTLVLGSTEFNGVFSPFFGTTGYDIEISDLTQITVISNNRSGEPESAACEYVEPETVKDADGNITQTIYTFKLKDGIKFSDGQSVTADDIIFSYKVFLDPNYDGSSTLYTLPIAGLSEYRYDDPNYSSKIDELKTQSQTVSDEEIKEFLVDYCTKDYEDAGADAVNDYTGFTNPNKLSGDALKAAEIQAYVDKESADLEAYRDQAIEFKFKKLEKEYINSNLASGEVKVPDVSGIEKVDDKTVKVTLNGVDPTAIWKLGISIAPAHYYGKDFTKGKLDSIKALNGAPLGAGPYVFESFKDNVVTLKANSSYYKGAPKLATIKYQVVDESNKLENIKLGNVDISDPAASPDMMKQVEEAGLYPVLVDNLGYGYIGINAERITDKNVRKGLFSLMNREPAVKSYYGDLAQVIERPMSTVSWAYPKDAKPYYPYDKAKALEFFKAAGYEQKDVNGKKVLEKGGKQLSVEVGIGGGGTMNHPSAPILQQMKIDMEELGADLKISDVDWSVLSDAMQNGTIDMWVAAWGATIDPDMYQVYNSKSPGNNYKIKNAELDQLMTDAVRTLNIEERKELYAKCLDIIMDEAVEMPVYQRKNLFVFNPANINTDTIAKDITPFYGYQREIEKLEMVAK